jgi:hypothetical protein
LGWNGCGWGVTELSRNRDESGLYKAPLDGSSNKKNILFGGQFFDFFLERVHIFQVKMAFKFFDNSEKKVKAHAQLSLMANCVKIHCWIEKKMFFYAPIYIYFIVRYLKLSLRLTEYQSLCMLERMGSSLPGYNFVTVEPKLRIILYDPIRIVRRSPNHIYHPVTP